MSPRTLRLGASFVALALLGLLALAQGAAAAPVTIAGPGQGAGRVENPLGTAVDPARNHDLYVADRNNFRIDKFDSEGRFLLAWGAGVADGTTPELQVCGPEVPEAERCFAGLSSGSRPGYVVPASVAVEQSTGEVYVADASNRRITKFSPDGEFIFMAGKNVNQTEGTDICTAEDVEVDGDTCGAGESGSGPGAFESPRALAVDSSGNLWVGDNNRVVQLDASGHYVSEAPIPGGGATGSLAIDPVSGDFYLKSLSLSGVRRYAPSGTPTDTLTETAALDVSGNGEAVAVDSAGNAYVGDCASTAFSCSIPYRFKVYDPAGDQVSQFGAGQVIGAPGGENGANPLALGNGLLYSASSRGGANSAVQAFTLPEPGPLPEDEHAEELLPTSATLAAELNPEGHETTYHFEYDTTPYAEGGPEHGAKAPVPDASLSGSGFDPEAVSAVIGGLLPGTTYHFRLVATNECESSVQCTVAGQDTVLTTPSAVSIDAQWATDLTSHSASLHAEMNPLGVEGRWWVEYDTAPYQEGEAAHGTLAAEAVLPGGFGDVQVGAQLTGLQPATTYHYRFAAEDEREGNRYLVQGPDRSFTTQPTGLGFSLADNRAWELVSPPIKFGGQIGFERSDGEGQIQAAANGDAIAYLSIGSVEERPEGNRTIEVSSVLSRRGGGGVWTSKDITPPHTAVTPPTLGQGREYKLFSTNLGGALLEPRDPTPLSPQATERTPYLRHNTEQATYTPLVTAPPALPGFGGALNLPNGGVRVDGATSDLSHVILQVNPPLAGEPQRGPLFGGDPTYSLYEWQAGRLEAVSVKPGAEGGATVLGQFGSGATSTQNAISGDGSRIFWSTAPDPTLATPPSGLYLRDTARGETLRLDAVQGGFGVGAANPVFQGASPDGTVALFTDSQQLTPDANESGRDLYRCEIAVEGGELKCRLSDLTALAGSESAEVQGLLAGMGEDATRAYLVADGVLDAQPNSEGERAVSGQPNLYRWEAGSGTRFIARLAAPSGGERGDGPDWGLTNTGKSWAFKRAATASPSGRYLAFMSRRSLTGYDNRDVTSGEPDQEVFRYDAAADQLLCASCDPAGARPSGQRGVGETALRQPSDPLGIWAQEGSAPAPSLAATLPEATHTEQFGASLYRPRAMHDNGRLFFNAADALVPADSNGNWDVYEYEPAGLGSCPAAAGSQATALQAGGGCVSLISSGTAKGESAFLDASEGGGDAFFLSSGQLSVLDEDQVTDVYDARVGGVTATVVPQAECLGEACQPAVSPPDLRTPASSVFEGPGNLAPAKRKARCPKGKRKARHKGKVRCVKRRHAKHHKHHRHHQKRVAKHNRRASR